MDDIIASIVTFKNDKDVLKKTIDSFLGVDLKTHLYVIDNSPTDELKSVCTCPKVEYIFTHHNLGFAAAHNIAIHKMMGKTKYSLILNPDVYFNKGELEKLYSFMERDPAIGLSIPKVFYPDGSLQYLCRLLPNPYDVLLRKIDIKILDPWLDPVKCRYELKFADYNKTMEAPYLSGCFMFVRTNVFDTIGVFDERYFLYFEDVDLSRRIHKQYRTVYYPEVTIYHGYARGSNKDIILFKQLVSSGIKYFNKWGWFFDSERKAMNNRALVSLRQDGPARQRE